MGPAQRCAMPSAPFGCTVFDLGRVGTYRAASKSVRNVDVCNSYTDVPATRAASDHRKRKADACPLFLTRPSRRRCYLTPKLDIVAIGRRPLLSATDQEFGIVPRATVRIAQALVQKQPKRGERWQSWLWRWRRSTEKCVSGLCLPIG